MSLWLIICTFIRIPSVYSMDYFVESYSNCNNVYNNENSKYVTNLGQYLTVNQCIEACTGYNKQNPNNYCDSYTYNEENNECYVYINNPIWLPLFSNQNNIDCGRIIYKCESDFDCSFNGQCNSNTGNCTCDKAWNGYKCGQLNLLPTIETSGYNMVDDGKNTSSWGGSVIYNNESNIYTMFVAEMENHCGINSWLTNSQIMYAESIQSGINGYNDKYQRKSKLLVPFAHSPGITFAPGTNEYMLSYVNNKTLHESPACICQDGSTPSDCKYGSDMTEITSFRYISNLSMAGDIDNWSDEIWISQIITGDSNFSPVILKNGTLVGMVRAYDTQTHTKLFSIFASNWKDNTTYKVNYNENGGDGLFPYFPSSGGAEDMYVYQDCKGRFHALFHNMSPTDYPDGHSETMAGSHAFSQDGINWQYGTTAFGNTVEMTNGNKVLFSRRERPHLIFDANDGCTPIALTSGVEYYKDATYTLLQPIAH